MHAPTHNPPRPALCLIALALLLALGAGASAQEPAGRPVSSVSQLPGVFPFREEIHPPPAGDTRQPELDYWIVSSRRSPQSGTPRQTADQLDYFYVNAAGHPQRSNLAAFRRDLNPAVPVCTVVHGSYSSWEALLDASVQVYRWLHNTAPGRPLQIVFYTWPSDPITTILPAVDIAILGRWASFNGFYLSQVVQQIPDGSRISFFAHSHGARVLASALHLLDGGEVMGYQLRTPGVGRRELRPIFVAAAIDHHWMNPGERFGRALNQVDHGLVLFNRRDIALTLYPLRRPFSHRPLGLIGFDCLDRRLQRQSAAKLAEVDVTHLLDTGHIWSHYFHKPRIAATMKPYLFFDDDHPQQLLRAERGALTSRANYIARFARQRPARRPPLRNSSSTPRHSYFNGH